MYPLDSNKFSRAPILIIGIGNEYRRDDGVGLIVVWQLKKRLPPRCTVIEETADGTLLMEHWKHSEVVLLVDATMSGRVPGSITRVDVQHEDVPNALLPVSSHALNIADTIKLARVMHQLPRRTIFYGVEGDQFDEGMGLTDRVSQSVPVVVQRIIEEVSSN